MKTNKGFSLVELIVVIAIMAIIAAVAVPVYNVYIDKANKASDQSLVSDVANALNLYYVANSTDFEGGYVVISSTGVTGDDVGLAALNATYGDDLSDLVLKYGGWTNDGLLSEVGGYSEEEFAALMNSTFVSVSTPDSLMDAVTSMTGLVGDVVNSSDPTQIETRLTALGMGDMAEKLGGMTFDSNEEKSTAISNLMVEQMAKMMQSDTPEAEGFQAILVVYSSAVAYAEATGDTSIIDKMNENLNDNEKFNYDALKDGGTIGVMCDGLLTDDGDFINQDFVAFGEANQDNNVAALNTMMGAIEKISGTYTDKESLTNPELYSSDSVAEQVNNYINTVKAFAGLDAATRNMLASLEDGSVAVFIAKDGSVSVVPGMAWLLSK